MTTTMVDILKEQLVGKTLGSDGAGHVFLLKIVNIDTDLCYEGEFNVYMEKEAKTTIYPDQPFEVMQ